MSVKMCSIGDLKNNLRILQGEARHMKYSGEFDLDGLSKGNPYALLPLYHHAFNFYNVQFSSDVMDMLDDSMYMKSDVRFMEGVYKVLRDMFHFKPSMTKEQFFTMNSFAERKIIMCVDVLRLVQNRCGPKVYSNPNIKVTSIVNSHRNTKKSTTDLSKLEPGSEGARSVPDLRSKAKGTTKNTMCSLMGLDENNWHLKAGYLQPCKDMTKGRKDKPGGVVANMVREFTAVSSDASANTAHADNKQDGKHADKHDGKHADAGHKANDWDPTGAVECILAKVRDLPTQLTSFMKAVDNRLQKIEERLEKAEGGGGLDTPALDKDTNNLLARLVLLENRLMLVETQKPSTEDPAESREATESEKTNSSGKKRKDKKEKAASKSPAAFASFEGGEAPLSDSLVLSTFSPIRQDIGDYNHSSSNDTLISLPPEDNRRLSSTPNQSPANHRSVPEMSQANPRSVPEMSQANPRSVPEMSPANPRSVPTHPLVNNNLVASAVHSELSFHDRPMSSQTAVDARLAPHTALSNSPLLARPPSSQSPRPTEGRCSSPGVQSECERRAAQAVSEATADSTLAWDTLDTSTAQQVERIRDMLKATQILLPGLEGQQQQQQQVQT